MRPSAMPLMPIPPTPTKWMKRVLRSITIDAPWTRSRFRGPIVSCDQLLDHVRDAGGGVGVRERRRGALHREQAGRLVTQGEKGLRQGLPGERALLDQDGGAGLGELPGVGPLVVVSRGRQGH